MTRMTELHLYMVQIVYGYKPTGGYNLTRLPGVSSTASAPVSPSIDSVRFLLPLASGVARTMSSHEGESGTVDISAASPSLCVRSRPLGEENGWPRAGEEATQSCRAGVAKARRVPPT